MTEDIIKVFSNYDGRFSLGKLYAAGRGRAAPGAAGVGKMWAAAVRPRTRRRR
jgi:hypothetical protein